MPPFDDMRRRARASLAAALLILLDAGSTLDAASYYFSQSGNDVLGDGSQAKPWQSITVKRNTSTSVKACLTASKRPG